MPSRAVYSGSKLAVIEGFFLSVNQKLTGNENMAAVQNTEQLEVFIKGFSAHSGRLRVCVPEML